MKATKRPFNGGSCDRQPSFFFRFTPARAVSGICAGVGGNLCIFVAMSVLKDNDLCK